LAQALSAPSVSFAFPFAPHSLPRASATMPAVVAEAAAATAAAASGAFNYNRANWFFDNGLRFGRFNTGYSMAMAQASMYREDIRDLTELTVTKQDTYHTVGVIFFVLNFQLIMAGRLGVHGPSPPGWLLGLYWTNICSALMFLVTFTWTAMHASARATAGGAYMLTRSVRLPIPTPKMLDQARTTGNTYEKQRVGDVFRIPFAMPAPKESVADPELGGQRVPISDRRMPKWYHDEVKELRKDEGAAAPSPDSNPEHFELYRGLQEEWWGYDIYGRIGVLYFMSHWLTSASLYSMCHVFGELRCLWPAWTVTACFVTAHYGILSLDIINKPTATGFNLPIEKVVPFVPVIAVLGMSIDYSVLTPTIGWQTFIYFLSWICYLIQFFWAIRLYSLAAPMTRARDMQEQPGQPWWPKEWALPPAFEDALYMVSAPKFLEPGQPTCLQQEMKAGKGQQCMTAPMKKSRDYAPALLPWKMFRGACITTISMWVLIMVGRAFEQVNGERFLLKQEGRVERWPSHMQPWMAPWTRKGSRNEMCHAGGCDRRLSAVEQAHAQMAQQLLAALGPIAKSLDAAGSAPSLVEPQPAPLLSAAVSWPAQLQPTLLASNGESLAVLSRSHLGATLPTALAGTPESFSFQGLDGLGEILGASWGRAGLMLTTASGAVAECPGSHAVGAWPCRQVGAKFGFEGLHAAVVARIEGTTKLRAAIILTGDDSILLLDSDEHGTEWLPAGEVHAPMVFGRAPHLSMSSSAEELVISMADGTVLKRAIAGGGAPKRLASPASATFAAGSMWHGACGLGGDRIAHLATPFGADAAPQLFLSSA